MPAYNDTPLATQQINQTQPLIRTNFTNLSDAFSVNHVAITAPLDFGKHKFLQMPIQAAAPVTSATELALYTKAVAGNPQLFLRRQSNGVEVDLTSSTTTANFGETTLPSGIIIKWGRTNGGTLNGNAWNTIMFPTPFPNNCFNVSVTSKTVNPNPDTSQTTSLMIISPDYTTAQFSVFNRRTDIGLGIPTDCCWFAIGN